MIEWKPDPDPPATTEAVGWQLITSAFMLGACLVWAIVQIVKGTG